MLRIRTYIPPPPPPPPSPFIAFPNGEARFKVEAAAAYKCIKLLSLEKVSFYSVQVIYNIGCLQYFGSSTNIKTLSGQYSFDQVNYDRIFTVLR